MEPQIITLTDFKAHCSEYLGRTKTDNFEYIVTQKGVPMAKIVPLEEHYGRRMVSKIDPEFRVGRLKGTVTIHGDIMAPVWPLSDEDD